MSGVTKRAHALMKEAAELVYAEVKRLATNVMLPRPHITSFCMAMGTACFYDANGPMTDRGYMRRVFELIEEFRDLKVSGEPLRLDRVGDKIVFTTDW